MANNNTPADDVRIELARTLAENAKPWSFGPEVVDAVMSRFDVRLRGKVTDAEVERASKAWWRTGGSFEEAMRAALEAAPEGRNA